MVVTIYVRAPWKTSDIDAFAKRSGIDFAVVETKIHLKQAVVLQIRMPATCTSMCENRGDCKAEV